MKYFQFIIISIIFLSSCHKDFKFDEIDYTNYNRLVGPEGGTINYYANYNNDAKTEVIVRMDVPQGALDSLLVFNMYQFEDFEVAAQMEKGYAKIGSKFLYFVPFYESEGYHEREQFDLNYHLSIKFNKPIKITYYPLADYSDLALKNWQEVELYKNYYKTTNRAYKVYRIKIPRIDQWGEDYNIFVNWTRQGYANGYDRTDVSYLITGRWSAADPWGTGEISMDNWQLVGEYNLDAQNDVVSFDIYDTDYIYVVARDIYLEVIPNTLQNFLSANYDWLQITRASYDEENYKVYFTDNSYAIFDKYQNFQYLIRENLTYNYLPRISQLYIESISPAVVVREISSREYSGFFEFQVILNNGMKLYFNGNGGLTGKIQYGFNYANLPSNVKDYLTKNHPKEAVTNITYDSIYSANYIVYLSSNAKVYFDNIGIWWKTYYFKLESIKLPEIIKTYFSTNFPNAIFSEINKTIWPSGLPVYDIHLVDYKWFEFTADGTLQQFEFRNLSENDLPAVVRNYIDSQHPGKIITNIYHIYTDQTEWFEIYFADLSYDYYSLSGVGN